MTSNSGAVVLVSRRYNAPAERVFDAWLDPKTAGKWLFATPTGQMVRCEIDARVGGHFRITRREDEDIDHTGEYLEIVRPTRLVFTFAVPKFSAQVTKVTVEIVRTGLACELTLKHENVLPEWASKTQGGWRMILDTLDENV